MCPYSYGCQGALMKKLGLSQKVYFTTAISFVLTVGVLFTVFINVNQMLRVQAEIADAQGRMSRFGQLNTYMVDMETGERGFMLSGDTAYLEPYNIAEAKFEEFAREAEVHVAKIPTQLDRLKKIITYKREWIEGPAVQEMMARRKLNVGRITLTEFVDLFKASSGKALTDKIRSTVYEAISDEEKKIVQFQSQAKTCATSVFIWSFVALGFVFFGFATVAFVSRSLSKSINRLIVDLDQVTGSVKGTAECVITASEQLTSASSKQSRSVQVTASAVEEMTSMMSKTADNAKISEAKVSESQQNASQGKTSIEQMRVAMKEIDQSNGAIAEQVKKSHQQIEDIVRIISEIGNKTKVINDIVFQTKLLSFNASVEAARAGEHGKGFSVVAEEVGKLAQTSGSAAHEIGQMLEQGVAKVKNTVTDMTSSIEVLIEANKTKVENGREIIARCGEILEGIVSNVVEVSHSVTEISSAVVEQNQGVSEINQSIQQIDTSTRENLETSSQTANSAKELMQQAELLHEVVSKLSSEIHGGRAPTNSIESGKVIELKKSGVSQKSDMEKRAS